MSVLQPLPTAERSCLELIRGDHRRLDEQLRDYALLAGVTAAMADRQEELLYPQLEPLVDAALMASLRSDHHRIEQGPD